MLLDDMPTTVIAIWLLDNAEYTNTDVVVLSLSMGYSLLALAIILGQHAKQVVARGGFSGGGGGSGKNPSQITEEVRRG